MMAAESLVLERFRQDAESIGQKNYEVQVKSHLESIKSEILQIVFYAVLALAGTFLFVRDQISLGELLATLASYASIQPLVGILFQCALTQGVAHAGLNRIESILRHGTSTPPTELPVESVPAHPEITMRGVYFSYEDASVLRGVDLTVPYGQKVALVGPSGSGKSTVISLLLRLYDPSGGEITLGGTDLRKLDLSAVRRQFGVVPQDTFLFHISVKENILLANPDATDDAVEEALRRANAWDFVRALPDGVDTILGENGATLSGGQRQRIGIARALVQRPAIFVFDEATSALDTAAEKVITETLTQVLGDHTAFIVAHRLSTVRFCDRVIVFDQGRIVQDGTYADLSSTAGPFRDLLKAQEVTPGILS
jgi:ABC-type multidrug transport system fused ATPase/permease subunit